MIIGINTFMKMRDIINIVLEGEVVDFPWNQYAKNTAKVRGVDLSAPQDNTNRKQVSDFRDEVAYPHLRKHHLCRVAYNADPKIRGKAATFLGIKTFPGDIRRAKIEIDGEEFLVNPAILINH